MPYTTSSSSPTPFAASHTPVDMADLLLLSPTPMPRYPRRSSPHVPTQQTAFHTLHRRGNDSNDEDGDGGKDHSSSCVIIYPPGDQVPPDCVLPPYFPSHTSTSSFYSSTPTISTTTRTVTQTMTPHRPSGGSTTPVHDPTTTTMPVSSSGLPVIVPDNRGLSAGQLAGVIVGSVSCALLLLLLFLWRLRRGAFGSGTLFGFRYGDARKPGWGGAGNEMRRKSREGYVIGASEPSFTSGSTFSFLSQPGTKPPSYSHAASEPPSSLHKPSPPPLPPPPPPPPRSPPPWSTSSSAFDNAYAVSSVSAHTRSPSHTAYSASASVSMSLSTSVSDNSTLVSVSDPSCPPPHPHPHPHPHTHAHAQSYPRPPEHPPHAPLIAYPHVFRGGPIPFPARRPASTGETVSTSMVSFDGLEGAHSGSGSAADSVADSDAGTREECAWEADTAESSQPLQALARGRGSESGSWRGGGGGAGRGG